MPNYNPNAGPSALNSSGAVNSSEMMQQSWNVDADLNARSNPQSFDMGRRFPQSRGVSPAQKGVSSAAANMMQDKSIDDSIQQSMDIDDSVGDSSFPASSRNPSPKGPRVRPSRGSRASLMGEPDEPAKPGDSGKIFGMIDPDDI